MGTLKTPGSNLGKKNISSWIFMMIKTKISMLIPKLQSVLLLAMSSIFLHSLPEKQNSTD